MFSDTDFQPFDTFELCWRWTEHNTNVPTEDLNKIKPLSSAKANEVWKRSLDFVEGPTHCLSRRLFANIVELDVSQLSNDDVRTWLCEQNADQAEWIIVSWTKDVAVVTEWSIFVRYWDDFCYPGSDDVSIWPILSESWSLLYFHYEVFSFGKTR